MDKIAVLVPCYNESKTVQKVVRDWKAALPEAQIYVYDNNSTDGTDELAREAGAIVRYEHQQGKGNVVRRMFLEIDAECYIMVDGDDTYPAEEARVMVEGIYRAARLSSATMKLPTHTETAAVFISLEEVLLGSVTLNELFNTIVEAFQEEIYKQVFEALASGTPAAGYARIGEAAGGKVLATKATLGEALDAVMPYVKAYGQPTIIGSYQALSGLYNPVATTTTGGVVIQYPTREDNEDIRRIGHVAMYKGAQVIELPNYLLGGTKWFYDVDKVFVMPAGAKPVKIAFKGDTMIQKNLNAVGGEKWEIFRTMGVGLAMANNYAVINVTDAAIDGLEDVDFTN